MYKSSTRSFPVYDSLRKAIIEQALKPGVKLPEDSIGETFSVSRTTVRNALVRLDAEGLVDLQPNRGASVADPTIEEAHDIFEMRQCLEREVMQRLCKMDSKPIVKALKAHLAEEQKYLDVDTTRSIRLAGEFHILLAELTGSKILANYVNEIVSRCSLVLARFAQAHSAQCGLEEHTEIIAAIEAGDADRATSRMHTHLHGVQDRALLNPDDDDKDNVSDILARYVTHNS
ncbi:GntR family transcriptional regulator [Neptunicoccus cionae]|uniref:GntR family transcriptional regulator n=1 Tax=Neptunicoccus cionae TaxID=2035344 RepID=UPI000C7930B0|nr:GntR family transcriptional regulator [Amylibacter cionae]PLS21457.1 GntR family transcriptional regulator [Amylibacter cionae]